MKTFLVALVAIPLLWAFLAFLFVVAAYRAFRGLPPIESEEES
jgi:hypothetical protein